MPRLELSLLCFLAVVGATGCPTKTGANLGGFDCDPKAGICVPRDGGGNPDGQGGGGSGGGGGGGQGGGGAGGGGGVTIQITTPSSPAYTNGSIVIQVAVSSASAVANVDIFDGNTKLGTVAFPFTFTWDTSAPTPVVEGPHEVTARATVASQTIMSAAVTIHVDRTAPEVSGRAPTDGAMQVLFSDPMHVTFSEAIAPATLTGAITLSTGSGAIPITTMLSADGKTVTIALSDRRAIVLPADVTVSLQPTIADLAGNRLGSISTWAWTVPVWVKLPTLAGKYPALAMDPNDRPIVLTSVEQDAIGSNDFVLQLARLGPTRLWDTTAASPQGARPTSRVSSRATVSVGPDGLPVVAWPESQANVPAAMHVAKWTGSGWDKSYGQLDAASGSGTDTYTPALGFSPAGELFLAWGEPNPTAFAVFTAKWTGSTWDPSYGNPGVIGANGAVLRFGANGLPVLSVAESSTTGRVSRWSGTAWATLPAYTNRQIPSLALDAMDRAVVLSWSGQASDQYLRLYFWSQSANAWVEEIPAIPTGLQPYDAQLIIPADGHPVIAWTEFDTTAGARVVRVTRHTGVQWDFAYGSLSGFTGTNSDGVTPQIALDRGGSPIVAWQETDGTLQSTYVWRSNH